LKLGAGEKKERVSAELPSSFFGGAYDLLEKKRRRTVGIGGRKRKPRQEQSQTCVGDEGEKGKKRFLDLENHPRKKGKKKEGEERFLHPGKTTCILFHGGEKKTRPSWMFPPEKGKGVKSQCHYLIQQKGGPKSNVQTKGAQSVLVLESPRTISP